MMGETVEEFFDEEQITKDHIEAMDCEGEYWERASRFVVQRWTWQVRHLSASEAKWMGKIREDLTEMRIEGKGVFG